MTKSSLKILSPDAADPESVAQKSSTEGADVSSNVQFAHVSVLREEVTAWLASVPAGLVVDCTAGGGGHSDAILAARDDVTLLALDQDPTAVAAATATLARHGARADVVHAKFSELTQVLADRGITEVSGIIADLGVSSHHLDTAERGFSFSQDGPLDMRMDPTSGVPLDQMLAGVSENDLADVLYRYGDIRASRRGASAVLSAWRDGGCTTGELADHLRKRMPRAGKIHPATLVFQALRMWVNDEAGELLTLLDTAPALLRPGGVMAVISFHSGEDRNVKRRFRDLAHGRYSDYERLVKKPVTATNEETRANPRARSAKLRGVRRRAEERGEGHE